MKDRPLHLRLDYGADASIFCGISMQLHLNGRLICGPHTFNRLRNQPGFIVCPVCSDEVDRYLAIEALIAMNGA